MKNLTSERRDDQGFSLILLAFFVSRALP